MADVAFYHLQREPLESALPKLLTKALEQDYRIVVRVSSEERLEELNEKLWTFGRATFLPHGSSHDGYAARQPVYLTTGDENPNGARILVVVDDAETSGIDAYDRALIMFDGHDEAVVSNARSLWTFLRDQGHAVTYWQQGERGWEKKA
jgi:DNA polymerase-3 subunit chi